MFGNAFGWPHLLVILAVVLILFGAPKLPGLARSLGQSMRIFRGEMKTMKSESADPAPDATAPDASAPSAEGTAASTASEPPSPTDPKP